jgi:hypothetical protein
LRGLNQRRIGAGQIANCVATFDAVSQGSIQSHFASWIHFRDLTRTSSSRRGFGSMTATWGLAAAGVLRSARSQRKTLVRLLAEEEEVKAEQLVDEAEIKGLGTPIKVWSRSGADDLRVWIFDPSFQMQKKPAVKGEPFIESLGRKSTSVADRSRSWLAATCDKTDRKIAGF